MWVRDYLDKHGPVFTQWGVDPKVINIVNAIRTNSWFKYEDLKSCTVARTGGRQGCKLGAIIFNSVYDLELKEVSSALHSAGIDTHFQHHSASAFWRSASAPPDTCTHLSDVTFVDDEAAIVMTKTGAELDRAIDILLKTYVEVFVKFSLAINWAPGKSEAMLKYRGKHAKFISKSVGSMEISRSSSHRFVAIKSSL